MVPLEKQNEERNAMSDSLHLTYTIPSGCSKGCLREYMLSHELQPLKWQERRESASMTVRDGVYFSEMVLFQCICIHALSLSSSLASQLTPSQPSSPSPLSSWRHPYPGTPCQAFYSMARVSAEPRALALHEVAL